MIPGLGRCPGGGHGSPLQCPCLENPMDRGARRAAVPGVAKRQTRLHRLRMHEGGASKADRGAGPPKLGGCSLPSLSFLWRGTLGGRFPSCTEQGWAQGWATQAEVKLCSSSLQALTLGFLPSSGLLSPLRAVFVPGLLLLFSRSVVSNSL